MKKKNKGHSLFANIIIPFLLIVFLQSGIFFCITYFGGVAQTLNNNAENVLKENVSNKKNDIDSIFSTRWSDLSSEVTILNETYEQINQELDTDFSSSFESQRTFLNDSTESLIRILRRNLVNGAYVILNNSEQYQSLEDEDECFYGLCIRDYSQTASYSGTSDLLLKVSNTDYSNPNVIAYDSSHQSRYIFNKENTGDYFYNPINQAFKHPTTNYDNLGYFSTTHDINNDSSQNVVSYTVPLISNGHPYGVLGIELTIPYLKTLLPESSVYKKNTSCFVLVHTVDGSENYEVLSYSGGVYEPAFGNDTSFTISKEDNDIISCMGSLNDIDLRGYSLNIDIYKNNTPFSNEKIQIIGFVSSTELYSLSANVRNQLLVTSVIIILISSAAVFVVCKFITNPINKLSKKVQSMDVKGSSSLDRVNITEIDNLVDSIKGLSERVNQNKVRTEFFSRMSHDMRTPMNAVIGFSSLELLENASNEELRDNLSKIHSSGTYLLGLINELLDITKIESEKLTLQLKPRNATEVFNEVNNIISEIAKVKGVNYLTNLPNEPCLVMLDAQRLNQVVMNILSNAVKFTPVGKNVAYSVMKVEKDDEFINYDIVIKDEGCGMSEGFMKKMYEPFSQESQGNGGTGLGLAIARQLVLIMGGTINCTSHKDQGTTFEINLSFTPVKEIPAEDALENGTILSKNDDECLKGKRILLCEDQPLNAQIATRLLTRKGIIVETAENGQVGYEKFAASAESYYDLILMDI
ncbi:MAG: hybrid sensor histidine kinase/response regulator, partial [Bacilli bacterium]